MKCFNILLLGIVYILQGYFDPFVMTSKIIRINPSALFILGYFKIAAVLSKLHGGTWGELTRITASFDLTHRKMEIRTQNYVIFDLDAFELQSENKHGCLYETLFLVETS